MSDQDFVNKQLREFTRETKRMRKVVEQVAASSKGMSPIAFQKALEAAVKLKADAWRDYKNASDVELYRSEQRKAVRDDLAKQLRVAKKRLQQINREIKEKLQMLSLHIEEMNMPQVPEPTLRRKDYYNLTEKFAGVYIAFYDGVVKYVGESCNIPQRLRSHETVKEDWFVSVIKTLPHERFFAECYFIWLFKPDLNREGLATRRELEQCNFFRINGRLVKQFSGDGGQQV
jgi:hypothetical protein